MAAGKGSRKAITSRGRAEVHIPGSGRAMNARMRLNGAENRRGRWGSDNWSTTHSLPIITPSQPSEPSERR